MARQTEEVVLKFSGDAASALRTLNQIGQAMRQLGKDFGQVGGGSPLSGAFKGISGLLSPLRAVSAATGLVGGAFKFLGGVVQTALGVVAAGAISSLVGSLKKLATQPVMLAARVEVLENVLYFLGQKAGYAREQLGGFLEELKRTGITTKEAAGNLTKMIQAHLDLSKASELARVAQDAAVISGENSSQAFEGIMHGITNLSSIVLRHRGIFVNLQEAYERFAKAAGTTAVALSVQQKQQIALEEVLRAGVTISGAYAESMDYVGKKITSLPRYFEEAGLALGKGFLPILGAGVDILTSVLGKVETVFEAIQPTITVFSERVGAGLRSLYERVQEAMGAIAQGFAFVRPYLQELGQILGHYLPQVGERLRLAWIALKNALGGLAATVRANLPSMAGLWTTFTDVVKISFETVLKILDGFRLALSGKGRQAAVNFSEAMANGLAVLIIIWEDYISKAVVWGYNLIASFASGIISGASEFITAAANYVGNLISQFFAAFSPPRKGILTGILTWGRGLINEYFRGFSQADFGILRQVGGAIKTALQGAVSLGDLPAKELVPTFRKIRELAAGVIADFRKTGEIGEEKLGKIGEILGAGGEELVKYLRLQMQQQKALKDMAGVQDEYAAAEAKGFIPAELKKRLEAAKARVEEAQDELSWQEQLIQAQQEGVDLQLEQVQAMKLLTQAIQGVSAAMGKMKMPKMPAAEAAEMPGVEAPEEGMPIFGLAVPDMGKFKEDIDAGIADAFAGVSERFEKAKKDAKKALADLPGIIREALTNLPGIIRSGLGQAFEVLREKVPWIDTLIAKFDQLKTWWNESWPTMLAVLLTVWTTAKATIGSAVDVIVGTAWPHLQGAIDTLTETIGDFGISWSDVWDAVKRSIGIVAIGIGAILMALVAIVVGVVNGIASALETMMGGWHRLSTGIRQVIDGLGRQIAGWINVVKGILEGDWQRVIDGFKQIGEGWLTAVEGMLNTIAGFFTATFGTIISAVEGFIEGVVGWFQNMKDRLVGSSIIPEMVDEALAKFIEFRDRATEIVQQARDWVTERIEGIASSFERIGEAITGAIGKLGEFLGSLAQAVIPDWLLPGSATPFELGIRGIVGVLGELSSVAAGFFVFQKMRTDLQALVGEGGLIPFFVLTTIQRFTDLKTQLLQLVAEMSDRLVQLILTLVNQAIALITRLRNMIVQLFTEIKTKVVQLIVEMVQLVLEALAQLVEEGKPLLEELVKIIEEMAEKVGEAFDKIRSKIKSVINKLDDLISKAKEAASALEDAGMMGASPSRFELSLSGINEQLQKVQANLGGVAGLGPRLNLMAAAPVAAGGQTSQQFYFGEGAFAGAFPNVRDSRDAAGFMESLNDLIGQASARANVPGGAK